MELSRSALETVIHRVETVIHGRNVHRVVLHGAFWWAALEHTEGKKTGQRGEAEHERGLLAGEIRRLLDEVLDGLVAQNPARTPQRARRRCARDRQAAVRFGRGYRRRREPKSATWSTMSAPAVTCMLSKPFACLVASDTSEDAACFA